jgi:hypothetical protein
MKKKNILSVSLKILHVYIAVYVSRLILPSLPGLASIFVEMTCYSVCMASGRLSV